MNFTVPTKTYLNSNLKLIKFQGSTRMRNAGYISFWHKVDKQRKEFSSRKPGSQRAIQLMGDTRSQHTKRKHN